MEKKFLICNKCQRLVKYKREDIILDCSLAMYDTQITRCPYCGQINVISQKPTKELQDFFNKKC